MESHPATSLGIETSASYQEQWFHLSTQLLEIGLPSSNSFKLRSNKGDLVFRLWGKITISFRKTWELSPVTFSKQPG